MKIVDRNTFTQMPAGTLFMKYKPCYFQPLCIKGDSIIFDPPILSGACPNDFYVQYLDSVEAHDCGEESAILFIAEMDGTPFKLDLNVQSRDGCFDQDQLFAVYERADVEALIARLQATLPSPDYMAEFLKMQEATRNQMQPMQDALKAWRGIQ